MKYSRTDNVALDSVLDLIPWYKKKGFVHPGFDGISYSFEVTSDLLGRAASDVRVEELRDDHWPGILKLDRTVYPKLDRERILKAYLTGSHAGLRTMVAVDGPEVIGVGSTHMKADGLYGMRNLIARSPTVAEVIVSSLLSEIPPNSKVIIKLPTEKKLIPMLEHATRGFKVTRLHSKEAVEINMDNLWMTLVSMI